MKHTKRTRAETIAGKSNSKHETPPQNRAAAGGHAKSPVQAVIAYNREADQVLEMVERAYKAARRGPHKEWLHGLYQRMTALQVTATGFLVPRPAEAGPAAAPNAGPVAKVETAALAELESACFEACDMLTLLSLPLSGYMNGMPGDGAGVEDIADRVGRRLMECFSALGVTVEQN